MGVVSFASAEFELYKKKDPNITLCIFASQSNNIGSRKNYKNEGLEASFDFFIKST